MRAAALVALFFLTFLSGCPASFREGIYGCADGRCPAGWFCRADGRCYSTPTTSDAGAMDARSLDAHVDAPGIDAAGVDAPGVDAPGVDAAGDDAAGDDAAGDDAALPTPDAAPTDSGAIVDCTGVADDTTCMRTGVGSGICCGNSCIDPTSDDAHCGLCRTPCGAGTPFCVSSTCRACRGGGDCPADAQPCSDAICTSSGTCTQDYVHSRCDGPTTPATGVTDCIGPGVCGPGGCSRGTLTDGSLCRDRTSQYYCGCGGMCLDADVYCGASTPYNTCAGESVCIRDFCNAIGRNCT